MILQLIKRKGESIHFLRHTLASLKSDEMGKRIHCIIKSYIYIIPAIASEPLLQNFRRNLFLNELDQRISFAWNVFRLDLNDSW